MRTFITLALALASITAFASDEAPSRGRAMVQFLDGLDGHWSGKGTRDELKADGRLYREKFDFELDVDRWGTRYDTRAQLETESGQLESSNNSFEVRGDNLFVQSNTAVEPVNVRAATPLDLSYEVQRADMFGRLYQFRFDYRLKDGRTLEAVERAQLNGVLLREDRFSVTK